MSRRQSVCISVEKPVETNNRNIVQKRIHFNEENIRATHHTLTKDYGLMNIPESKTPYPRTGIPVEPEDLRSRLQQALENANKMLVRGTDDDSTLQSFYLSEPQTPFEFADAYQEERNHEDFCRKRKQFNQGEFIVTKQKLMSREISEPGPSIGERWHMINDNGEQSKSSLKLFMSQSQPGRENSTVNYETLREITSQLKFRTHSSKVEQ